MNPAIYQVLVADDDPTVALLMPVALAAPNFSVRVVSDGAAALIEFKNISFDIVLLDVEMPEMDGFEVCRTIRQEMGSQVPVFLVSGHNDRQTLERASALGAGHLAKPLDWSSLGERLREILGTLAAPDVAG